MRAVFRICGNESQPGLQLVEKKATPLVNCPGSIKANVCLSMMDDPLFKGSLKLHNAPLAKGLKPYDPPTSLCSGPTTSSPPPPIPFDQSQILKKFATYISFGSLGSRHWFFLVSERSLKLSEMCFHPGFDRQIVSCWSLPFPCAG